ncbi:cardioacceleratory peptide receptor-like [Haliotis rubra]|uniref:cardioacceleratory peptide receptor-like n=1 Tax=Haliotis rubra TaxID=36100 RepID=UPI001EE5C4D7|nr:cardioacceleratory peptide receptor-like [Haliotis rubra]
MTTPLSTTTMYDTGFNDSDLTVSTNTTPTDVFYFYKTEQISFLCVLFIFIIVGNSMVILTITLTKNRRSRMNFFILNLAIADLSAGLVNVFTDMIWKTTIDWHAGLVGCKLVRYFMGVVTYASTYALVALSIDRLDAIARPLSFTGSHLRSRVLVGLSWASAMLFSLPMLIINETKIINGSCQCWIEFPQPWFWKLYITTIAIVLFFIPAVIIAVCYIIIVVIIWTKTTLQVSAPKGKHRYIKNGGHVYAAANNARFKDSATSSRGLIPKAKIKTIKMTLVIVLVFIICWSPYFVFDLVDVYLNVPRTQDMVAASTFIQSLAPLNSAANPIIYFGFNAKMCIGILKKGWKHNSPTSQSQLTSI